MKSDPEISIVIPCLNEEKAIAFCLSQILNTIEDYSLNSEIIVVDNNSSDKTAEIVSEYEKKYSNIYLIKEMVRGYGSAYLAGFKQAKGRYIFIADADGTYDFREMLDFIRKIKEEKVDLVIGNRFSGRMEENSMPWLHQHIGNPFFLTLAKFLFSLKINDIYCGARIFKRELFEKIKFESLGMEFAVEMIIKASELGYTIMEIPISYKRRIGESKLRTLLDGLRSIKFMIFINFLHLNEFKK